MWYGINFWLIFMIKEFLFTALGGITLLSFISILMLLYIKKENSNAKIFFQLVGIFYTIVGIYFIGGVVALFGIIFFIYITLFYFEPKDIKNSSISKDVKET